MLVSLSIGMRGGVAKDSLRNILDQGAFCVNVVTEAQLEAMNRTAASLPPDDDEFAFAGLSGALGGGFTWHYNRNGRRMPFKALRRGVPYPPPGTQP